MNFILIILSKINKLQVNFSKSYKISLIIEAINNKNISLSIQATGIKNPNLLGAFLEDNFFKPNQINTQNFVDKFKVHSSTATTRINEGYKNTKKCNCCAKTRHLKKNCHYFFCMFQKET